MAPWTPVDGAPGLYAWEVYQDGLLFLRSVALRLPSGGTLVVSPVRGTPAEGFAALEAIGRPELLLAPNHFHNMGLTTFLDRYSGAVAVAAEGALPRLRKRIPRPIGDLREVGDRLPEGVSFLVPEATRNGEAWLRLPTPGGVAWVVGDAFVNLPSTPRTPLGLLLWALGVCPGLRISRSFKGLGIRDKAAYARWLVDALQRDRPTLLIPAHGEICRGEDLTERLLGLARSHLPLPASARQLS